MQISLLKKMGVPLLALAGWEGTSPVIYAAPLTFTEKCAQAGVLCCIDFDSVSELFYTWPQPSSCDSDPFLSGKTRYCVSPSLCPTSRGNAVASTDNQAGACHYPIIDTAVSHSGAGSLKFTIPSSSGSGAAGLVTETFQPSHTSPFLYIAPGSPKGNVVYIQYYQRFDPNFQSTNFRCNGGCGGWKQAIFFGNRPNGSDSSTIEVTQVNGWQRDVPQMYGQQGYDDYGVEDIAGCTYAKATSQGGSGSGYESRSNYQAPLNPTCQHYPQNQWMEFTIRIEVNGPAAWAAGCAGGAKSRVQMWVDGKLAVDNPCASISYGSSDGDGVGSIDFLPYHTNKDSTQTHPVGYTWYDDLVISTQPIAMTSGTRDSTPPAPPGRLRLSRDLVRGNFT